ncbi:MAG: hypothetical protein AB1505_32695 [Candidatus Latescibacterota bacterium]
MFRRLVARIFGFEREVARLRQQIRALSWDSSFGMWTRGAFLQFCEVMPRGRRFLAFMDLARIHQLNQELGYAEVDRRVQATFALPLRRSDIVARWYSGDEIVILFDSDRAGAERKMAELADSARRQGLTFVHRIGEWEVGRQEVEQVVNALAAQVTAVKAAERQAGPA